MNNCQKNIRFSNYDSSSTNEIRGWSSRKVREQDRNKTETLNSIGARGAYKRTPLDWFPDAVGNQFRPPPLPVSTDPDYKSGTSLAVCAVRSRHFGPLCGIKNAPRIFSTSPTLFLFFFSRYREIRGSGKHENELL